MYSRSISIALVLIALTSDRGTLAQGAEGLRSYADGSLAPADFKAAVPDPQPVKDGVKLRAMTDVEIHYSTRYRWEGTTSGEVSAWLTRFDCESVLMRDKCWNKEPDDLRLLDHEQGHFDISEINARKAHQHFKQLVTEKTLIGHGSDERSAMADLDKQVHGEMQKVFDRERSEQIEYDRATRHGRDFAAQAKQRAAIDKLLRETEPKESKAQSK